MPADPHTQLLRQIAATISVPRGLAPTARWEALIAVEERQREIAYLTDQVAFKLLTPGAAAEQLRDRVWRTPMPTGPKLVPSEQ